MNQHDEDGRAKCRSAVRVARRMSRRVHRAQTRWDFRHGQVHASHLRRRSAVGGEDTRGGHDPPRRPRHVRRRGEHLERAATATTLRSDGAGGVTTTDGPFLETKEALGGFYLIDASDLDEAIKLASMLPEVQESHRGVEVRAVVEKGLPGGPRWWPRRPRSPPPAIGPRCSRPPPS